MTTTKPKKTTKKQAAPDVAEFATEAPVPDEAVPVAFTLVPVPDDFLPFTASTTSEDLSALLHSISAFELAHNASERVAYIRTLTIPQFEALYAWAREIEWGLDGKPEGVNAVAAVRASKLMAPEFFHPKLARDLSTEAVVRLALDHIIDDAVASVATEAEPLPVSEGAALFDDGDDDTDDDDLWDADEEAGDDDVADDIHATAPAADADGQLQLVQEPTPPKKPLTPLTFQSGEQVASVRLALQARAEDLKSEAKRLSGLGRTAEAAALEREAKDITEQLLRQVTAQHAIPFNESETLPQAIKRAVQGEVRYRARTALLKSVAMKKGETKADAEQRALGKLDDLEQLIGNVGEQAGLIVAKLIVEAADRGKEAGRVERVATASAIAREAIQAVEAAMQRDRDAA